MMTRVLIVEKEQDIRNLYSKSLFSAHQVSFCADHKQAYARLGKESFDAIILDLQPPSEVLNFLPKFIESAGYSPVIATSETGEPELIVQAIKSGVFDFILKPYGPEKMSVAIEHALENKSLKNEIDYLRRQQDVVYDINRIVAVSPIMKKTIAMIQKLAGTDSTLLMTGETGTGKSFLSGCIHFNSRRKNKAFVTINCANIPEALLESELFGHEVGAFTGAYKARTGRLEQANGGTVFLDEIGELSPMLQAKLLRVLEEKAFERLGGNRTIHSDIRIIAATNRNLEDQVANGTFREDLYYRINVLRIHLPPLRERTECIEPLADYLLQKICRSVRKHVDGFSPDVLDHFKRYSWPGNIREFSNTIERAVLLEEGRIIRKENISLPESVPVRMKTPEAETSQSLSDQELNLILEALEKSLWIQKDAARLLGVTPRVLHYKIKKYGITHPRWYKNK
jgi:DNA-binding NtrC family response regulator